MTPAQIKALEAGIARLVEDAWEAERAECVHVREVEADAVFERLDWGDVFDLLQDRLWEACEAEVEGRVDDHEQRLADDARIRRGLR